MCYKLRDKERSKESAYVLVGFLARPFVSCVSRIARYHRRLWRTMASDEASGRKAGAAAAEENPILFAHFSVIYAIIWKKRKFIQLFLELCIESRSFADEK